MSKKKNELDRKRVAIALVFVIVTATVVTGHVLSLPAFGQSHQPEQVSQDGAAYPVYQFGACCTQLIVNAGSGAGRGYY